MTSSIAVLLLAFGPSQDVQTPTIAGERYTIDRSHTEIGFSVRHLGLAKVRGAFRDVSGIIHWVDEEPTRSSVTIVIKAASIDTGNESRDKDLRENFFHVDSFPVLTFQSTRIDRNGSDYVVVGDLEIRGIRREVSLPLEHVGSLEDNSSRRVGFSGTLSLDRRDFGVQNPDHPAEKRFVIGHRIDVALEVEAVRQNAAAIAFDSRQKRSVGEELLGVLEREGGQKAAAWLGAVTAGDREAYHFAEREFLVLGLRLLQLGRSGDAVPVLRAALAEHPASLQLKDLLGQALAAQSDREGSRRLYAEILEADPFHAAAREMVRLLDA